MSGKKPNKGRGRGRGSPLETSQDKKTDNVRPGGGRMADVVRPPSGPAGDAVSRAPPPGNNRAAASQAASGGGAAGGGKDMMGKHERHDSGSQDLQALEQQAIALSLDDSSASSGAVVDGVRMVVPDAPTELFLAPKVAPGQRGRNIGTVATNMCKIDMPGRTPVFRYEMQILGCKGTQTTDFCKNPQNDYYSNKNKRICYSIFIALINHAEHKKFFKEFYQMAYDRARIIYTLERQKALEPQKTFMLMANHEDFCCSESDFASLELDPKVTAFQIKISPAEEFELIMDNVLPSIEPDLLKRCRDLQQFLEIATNQNMFLNFDHVLYGNSAFSLKDFLRKNIGQGRDMLKGLKKSVRMVDGDAADKRAGKAAVPVLQLDTKITAFFQPVKVTEYLELFFNNRQMLVAGREINEHQWRVIRDQLKGLAVKTLHDAEKNHTFTIAGLSQENFSALTMEKDGRTMTLSQYYKNTYGKTIKYLRLPALVQISGPRKNYYPMELCQICEHQRVDMAKQTPEQMQTMIKEAALTPSNRQAAVASLEQQSGIKSNQFLEQMGIRIQPTAMQAPARQLPQPDVIYQQNVERRPDQDRATWMTSGRDGRASVKFDNAAVCKRWVALVFLPDQPHHGLTNEQVFGFLHRLQTKCCEYGMTMPECGKWDRQDPNAMSVDKILEVRFKEWAAAGVNYILFLTRDKKDVGPDVRGLMKLYEQKYSIVTQNVIQPTVQKCLGPQARDVLDKIVAKTNLKLGGRNYRLKLETTALTNRYLSNKIMFVGMDVNHPPPMSAGDRARGVTPKEPSVVGICANVGKTVLDFVGDYGYQDARQEQMQNNVIVTLWTRFLEMFLANRGDLPSFVFLYRDGFDNKKILIDEIPFIRQSFEIVYQKHGRQNPPKLVVINLLKRHNVRLFPNKINPGDKAPQQNVKPGTIVDTVITHPTQNEFYLNSHVAIQGTAKTPLYQMVLDEVKLPADDVQGITHMLCFNHQIVTGSISQPACSMGAHEIAKRGKNNYRIYSQIEGSVTGDSSDSGRSSVSDMSTQDQRWSEITERLSVAGTGLQNVRFNA